jgi:hypothetical protein
MQSQVKKTAKKKFFSLHFEKFRREKNWNTPRAKNRKNQKKK